MMFSPNRNTLTPLALALLGLCALHAPALAQEGRPTPQPAVPATVVDVIDEPEAEPAAAVETVVIPDPVDINGRRPAGDDLVVLSFKDVSVEETIPFIVQATGKVVMPVNITTLKAKKITLVNDRPIDRAKALDLLFQAFQLNDVGIIETDEQVIIAVLSEMPRHSPPVIGPDEDIMSFTNLGAIVTKIFSVENTDAENIAERLQDTLPDHATVATDANSNQILVTAHVGLCQRLGHLIEELDRNYVKVKTQTFRLAYADASEIASNILDLFEDTGTSTTRSSGSRAQQDRRRMTPEQRRRQGAAAQRTTEASVGPTVELRVTVNVQQNSVTVSGEPTVVEDIAGLINEAWDLPRPETTKKVYHLQYTDPIKMQEMLQELLGEAAGGGGVARRTRSPGGATGQRADVSEAIGGIYQIQAYPDSNSLVVICKTEESFNFLDSLITDLDQPIYPGIPVVVELKHADAEQVADQVNAIFAPAGARVDIQRRATGLEGIEIGGPAGGTADAGGTAGREGDEGGTITFPWQQGRQAEDETPESPLIGKIRVVPIHRQNAVMILAAPEYRDAVRDIIMNELDKPGRQVMIAAIIAEVVLTDELALGLRWGNLPAELPTADNRLFGRGAFSGEIDNPLSGIFDSGTLTVTSNLTAVLDALDKKTKFRILQDPVVFTADNQEASFFQGQDVPIQQATQGNQGFVTQSFEYQAVGIGLNARPRITMEGGVDMEINLVISNINVAATAAASSESAPFFDRRETTTQVIVQDGQTIVISGILKDEESRVTRKVPLLGDIPWLGALFTSVDNSTTRTELLAFVTPYVVETPDENDVNFNERARQRLENISKSLKEQDAEQKDLPEQIRKRLLQPAIDKGRIPADALDQPADEPDEG